MAFFQEFAFKTLIINSKDIQFLHHFNQFPIGLIRHVLKNDYIRSSNDHLRLIIYLSFEYDFS